MHSHLHGWFLRGEKRIRNCEENCRFCLGYLACFCWANCSQVILKSCLWSDVTDFTTEINVQISTSIKTLRCVQKPVLTGSIEEPELRTKMLWLQPAALCCGWSCEEKLVTCSIPFDFLFIIAWTGCADWDGKKNYEGLGSYGPPLKYQPAALILLPAADLCVKWRREGSQVSDPG